jgi:hypothetical protein
MNRIIGWASMIALFILLYSCMQAQALTCQSSAGRDGHYMWRMVDGRKCWYRGTSRVSKTKLQWYRSEPRKAMAKVVPPPVVDRTDRVAPMGAPVDPPHLVPLMFAHVLMQGELPDWLKMVQSSEPEPLPKPRVIHTIKPKEQRMSWVWVVLIFGAGIGTPMLIGWLVYRHEEGKLPIPKSWRPKVVKEKPHGYEDSQVL